jgi:hypothetical protein
MSPARPPWKLVVALSVALAATPLLKVGGNCHSCVLKRVAGPGERGEVRLSREENLAILLEAYRNKRGEYPETLWQLHRASCSHWPLPDDLGVRYARGASGYELTASWSVAQK